MNQFLQVTAEANHGVFTRTAALASGYSSKSIQRELDRGAWSRLRRGVYIETSYWQQLDPEQQHIRQAVAAALRCNGDLVFTLVTAAILHGLPHWGVPLHEIHAIRGTGIGGRREAGICHRRAQLPPDQVEVVNGLRVCSKERLMVDVGRAYDFEQAIVINDAALRAGADRDLAKQIYLSLCYSWPSSRAAANTITFADSRAESPGESRLRVQCRLLGLPTPEPQGRIYDDQGQLIARADLVFWEQRTVVEFDGKVKYGMNGTDASGQVYAEKLREDAIREAGFEVVRITWADLTDLRRLERKLRGAFARAARRR